jgi:hypothetical protein
MEADSKFEGIGTCCGQQKAPSRLLRYAPTVVSVLATLVIFAFLSEHTASAISLVRTISR